MAILIDSYGKENNKDFLVSSSYTRLNLVVEMARNIIGIITNRYSVMDEEQIQSANSNKCEYIINGRPIWVTAKPLNSKPIFGRLKSIIPYVKGDKHCLFYYKDYNFIVDKTNG